MPKQIKIFKNKDDKKLQEEVNTFCKETHGIRVECIWPMDVNKVMVLYEGV